MKEKSKQFYGKEEPYLRSHNCIMVNEFKYRAVEKLNRNNCL